MGVLRTAKSIYDHTIFLMQSLSFARVASVVRACAFKIDPGMLDPGALARKLPFVGAARAQQIWDIAKTGTTEELEQHR